MIINDRLCAVELQLWMEEIQAGFKPETARLASKRLSHQAARVLDEDGWIYDSDWVIKAVSTKFYSHFGWKRTYNVVCFFGY